MWTSLDSHSLGFDIENCVPVFHTTEAVSSSSAAAAAESGGRSPPASTSAMSRRLPIGCRSFVQITTSRTSRRSRHARYASGSFEKAHRRKHIEEGQWITRWRVVGGGGGGPASFGDLIMVDHVVLGSFEESSREKGGTAALTFQGHVATWTGCHLATAKAANHTMMGLIHFSPPPPPTDCTRSGAESYRWLLGPCCGVTAGARLNTLIRMALLSRRFGELFRGNMVVAPAVRFAASMLV